MAEAPLLPAAAPAVFETAIVLSAGMAHDARLAGSLRRLRIQFGAERSEAALDASLRWGKGRHPATLNFGDSIAYAAPRSPGFRRFQRAGQTDIEAA